MGLDLDLTADDTMDVYFDLLTVYLLVESALGECELHTRIGIALDSGDNDRMAAELRNFEALPEELRSRVLEGDPTLTTMLEVPGSQPADAPAAPQRRSRGA